MPSPTANILPIAAACGPAPSAAAPSPRLQSTDQALVAGAWRLALAAAHATARRILGRSDADLDDIAAAAALRTLSRTDLPLTHEAVLHGAALDRVAASIARHLARDLVRARRGRRDGALRRVDPLRRADTVALADAWPVPLTPSAEAVLLAQEHEREVRLVWAAAERLPRAQRDAVAARLAGRRPLPPAARQALRAALTSLRAVAMTPAMQARRGSAEA